jgi:hypothetical protein
MKKKMKHEDILMAIDLAKSQGIDVVRNGDEIFFIDPQSFYFRKLNKDRYRGKGRPRESDYDKL